MMIKIVGLNSDNVFYQVKIKHEWKQFTKPIADFIYMFAKLFPEIMKQSKPYRFTSLYSLANWLYNYGENIKPCDTYIFYYKR